MVGVQIQSDGSSLGTAYVINFVGSSSVSSQPNNTINIELAQLVLGPPPSAETGWTRISNDPVMPVMAFRNDADTADVPILEIGSADEEDDIIINGWLRSNGSGAILYPDVNGVGSIGGSASVIGFSNVNAAQINAGAAQPSTLFYAKTQITSVYPFPSGNTNAYGMLAGDFQLLRLRAGNAATDIGLFNSGQRTLCPLDGNVVTLGRDTTPWDESHVNVSFWSGQVSQYTTVLANYSANSRDWVISGDSTSVITTTLPDPSTVTGQVFVLKNLGSANFGVVSTSTASIDGSATTVIPTWGKLMVQSIGSRYATL